MFLGHHTQNIQSFLCRRPSLYFVQAFNSCRTIPLCSGECTNYFSHRLSPTFSSAATLTSVKALAKARPRPKQRLRVKKSDSIPLHHAVQRFCDRPYWRKLWSSLMLFIFSLTTHFNLLNPSPHNNSSFLALPLNFNLDFGLSYSFL